MKRLVFVSLTVLVILAFASSGCGYITENAYLPSSQDITPEGHPIYYILYAHLYDDHLLAQTVNGEYITVEGLEALERLTVRVSPEYGGTILIVRHWQSKLSHHANEAELVVRTLEQKELWETAIEEKVEAYQKKLQPRDVLPE